MTKKKADPCHLPPIFPYGEGENAFHRARDRLTTQGYLLCKDACCIERYDDLGYELWHARAKQNEATTKQAKEQIEAISKAASELAEAFKAASAPVQQLMNAQMRESRGIANQNYNFSSASIANMDTAIAAAEALQKLQNVANLDGIKGRGPSNYPAMVDEIADTIAKDFFRLTQKSPTIKNSIIKADGAQKVSGPFAEFFREIFTVIAPGIGFETAARQAVERWKQAQNAREEYKRGVDSLPYELRFPHAHRLKP